MKKTKKRKTLYFTFLFATNVVAFSFLSIKCNSNNKNSNNYRFLGIDTPETRTKDADGN